MHFDDNILLSVFKPRSAFLDQFSLEESTGIVKRKYKLLTLKDKTLSILGVYVFHILTTTEGAYVKDRCFKIHKSDWDYREPSCLNADHSIIDIQKVDVLNEEKILNKVRDSRNKFSHAGILNQAKFSEVIDFIKDGFIGANSRTDFDVKEIVNSILNETVISAPLIEKYDL